MQQVDTLLSSGADDRAERRSGLLSAILGKSPPKMNPAKRRSGLLSAMLGESPPKMNLLVLAVRSLSVAHLAV